MNWKKNTLLALLSATALVGVAASASAEDWVSFSFWSPQASSHYDRDRGDNDAYYGRYSGRAYYDQNHRYRSYNRAYYGGEHSRSWNGGYNNGYGYGNGYGNSYYGQQDRGGYRSYGEHRDRHDDDD